MAFILGAAEVTAQRPPERAEPETSLSGVSPQLAAKLNAPFGSAVAAKPLRESLHEIAAISQINLWLDRRVDPGLEVSIPAGSKSVFQAVAHAAQSVDLDAVAAGNVLVVGRPEWATLLAGAILALPSEIRQSSDHPPIEWPALTTPTGAIKISTRTDGPDTLALPHDLWPAVSWRGVSPQLAVLLITAQFDLMPTDPYLDRILDPASVLGPQSFVDRGLLFSRAPGSPATAPPAPAGSPAPPVETRSESRQQPNIQGQRGLELDSSLSSRQELQPLRAPPGLVLAYPNGPHVPQLRKAAQAADPQSRFRTGRPGAPLELTGSAAAHAAAAAAYFQHAGAAGARAIDLDGTRFSLRLRDAPAQDVFAQLATTAGRQLQIARAAAAACQNRITFEVQEVTLGELTQQVADEVGVTAAWTAESLQIDLAR